MPDVRHLPWRVGRSLGRTIYAQVGDEPSKDDILLGMMDDMSVAALIVEHHNFFLRS